MVSYSQRNSIGTGQCTIEAIRKAHVRYKKNNTNNHSNFGNEHKKAIHIEKKRKKKVLKNWLNVHLYHTYIDMVDPTFVIHLCVERFRVYSI